MIMKSKVSVAKSGNLYLVSRGKMGQLVNPDSEWAGQPAMAESILAHCNAQEEWEDVSLADCPRPVRTIAAEFSKSQP